MYLYFKGGWIYHAPRSLDATRKHSLPNIHCRIGCLELRCGSVGNIYIWNAAVVSAYKPRGKVLLVQSWSYSIVQVLLGLLKLYCKLDMEIEKLVDGIRPSYWISRTFTGVFPFPITYTSKKSYIDVFVCIIWYLYIVIWRWVCSHLCRAHN